MSAGAGEGTSSAAASVGFRVGAEVVRSMGRANWTSVPSVGASVGDSDCSFETMAYKFNPKTPAKFASAVQSVPTSAHEHVEASGDHMKYSREHAGSVVLASVASRHSCAVLCLARAAQTPGLHSALPEQP